MERILYSIISCVITLNCWANIELHYPYDGGQISDDFYFICKYEGNNALTLEISTTNSFDEIIYRNSSRWLTYEEYYKQMPITPQELGNGTYYWRVSDGENYSTSWKFSITGQDEPNNNYTIIRDKDEYTLQVIQGYNEPLVLSSLWIRSENTNNGLCQFDKGGYNHGIALKDDIIYISFGGNQGLQSHINRYNANTGESIDSILIDYTNFSQPPIPLSDLGVDDYGNLYATSCGSMSLSNHRDIIIDVLEVNPQSTIARVIKRYTCKLPLPDNNKYDPTEAKFINITGNVLTGEFVAYSVLDGVDSYAVCSWEFNRNITAASTTPKFLSTTTDSESRIFPLNVENSIYIIDNKEIYPTIYKNRTNKGDFTKESSFIVSNDPTGNGIHIFKHGNTPMMLYGCNYLTEGSMFELISLSPNFLDGTANQVETFTGIKSIWKFPKTYLGGVKSKLITPTTLATTKSEIASNGLPITKIYIYSAGNGLAAYQIAHYTTTKIENVVEEEFSWKLIDDKLLLSDYCNNIVIYNTLGNIISTSRNTNIVNLHNMKGLYIIKADNNIFKIII